MDEFKIVVNSSLEEKSSCYCINVRWNNIYYETIDKVELLKMSKIKNGDIIYNGKVLNPYFCDKEILDSIKNLLTKLIALNGFKVNSLSEEKGSNTEIFNEAAFYLQKFISKSDILNAKCLLKRSLKR